MNDEKRFSASTPTVPELADGTPPERQIPFPLTPPATDEWLSTSNPQSLVPHQSLVSAALDLIKQRKRYISTELRHLRNLLTRLEELSELQSFVDNKLRLGYNPLDQVLHIQPMPTPIHESFSEQVSNETKAQLRRIKSGNDEAARFAARI
ncbi:hypothetical protein LSUB1_G001256 [Lachnellula subtilissima]|uniref:Uncharacterized protein n=1 Tax=Lachnellula subtilissima TaxID=602034 RepID=A0A8H8UGY9_9HELO|nr:hypothetical protein LSUB1_G001256 [Lachnellula subtilissima]